MLSKKLRFHSRGGVRYTYKDGKTIRSPLISVVYTENARGRQRFAVVVSKKIFKSAVKRNAIRRRVYEAIRLEKAALGFTTPRDCIFTVYSPEVLTLDFSELRARISWLLKKTMI